MCRAFFEERIPCQPTDPVKVAEPQIGWRAQTGFKSSGNRFGTACSIDRQYLDVIVAMILQVRNQDIWLGGLFDEKVVQENSIANVPAIVSGRGPAHFYRGTG
ncbi:hypothetical protein D3C86_1788470 [compost metagenome]